MPHSDKMSFEQALKRLEEIVTILEEQDITLEQSVALYKEGAICGNVCRQKLDQARHELEIWQGGQKEPVAQQDSPDDSNLPDDVGDLSCVPF